MADKKATRSKFGKGTLEVSIQQGIKAKELHKLIDTIIIRHGCYACGLVGLDLDIRVNPPDLLKDDISIGARMIR